MTTTYDMMNFGNDNNTIVSNESSLHAGNPNNNSNSNNNTNHNNVVTTWLLGIGLGYVTTIFENAGIVTPTALAELDVTYFQALGISNADDRRKLFYLIQRIKMQLDNETKNNSSNIHTNNNDYHNSNDHISILSMNSNDESVRSNSNRNNEMPPPPPPHTQEGIVPTSSTSSSNNNDTKENNRNTTTTTTRRNSRKSLVVDPNVLIDKSTLVGPIPKSPLAAIKSRMRRIENIRQQQLERQQQMIELTQHHHETVHSSSSIVSPTTETAGTADMTQSEPEHEEDANETMFFDSFEENQMKGNMKQRRRIPNENDADYDDDDDSFWDINHENDDETIENNDDRDTEYEQETITLRKHEQQQQSYNHHHSQQQQQQQPGNRRQSRRLLEKKSVPAATGHQAKRQNGFTSINVDGWGDESIGSNSIQIHPSINDDRTRRRRSSSSSNIVVNNTRVSVSNTNQAPSKTTERGANSNQRQSMTERGVHVIANSKPEIVSTAGAHGRSSSTPSLTVSKSSSSDTINRRDSSKTKMTADELFEDISNNSMEVSNTPSATKVIATMKKNMSMSKKRDSGKMVITAAELFQEESEENSNNDQHDEYNVDTRKTPTATAASHNFQQQRSNTKRLSSSSSLPTKRRESGKMHITADELFDEVVDDSLDITINSSITSTSSSRHSSSQLTQQKRSTSALPAIRRSNLQAPTSVSSRRPGRNSMGGATSSNLAQPSKSIRTGKRLSTIPSNEVMLMSPLGTDNPHEELQGGNEHVTARRNKKTKPRTSALPDRQIKRSLSLESIDVVLVSDQEEDLLLIMEDESEDEAYKSDTTANHSRNINYSGFGINNIASQQEKSRRRSLLSSNNNNNRRSSVERPKLVSGVSTIRRNSNNQMNNNSSTTSTSHRNSFSNSENGTTIENIVMNRTTLPENIHVGATSSNNSSMISYQGIKEDDSFKTQIQALRVDNESSLGESSQRGHGKETDENEMRIRVVIRKRPMSKSEVAAAGDVDIIHPFDYGKYGRILVYQPKTRVDLTKEIETIPFAYDNVFDEYKSNIDIYQRVVRQTIPLFFHGQWTSIFAYGQTGSGKTYTMMGCNVTTSNTSLFEETDASNLGLYYMAAIDIFNILKLPEYSTDLTLSTSMFEIYGGKLYDLLNDRKPVKCLEDSKGKVCFPGLSEHGVYDPEQLITLIEKGGCNRSTGTTSRNADSSRSHAVLQLHLRKKIVPRGTANNNSRTSAAKKNTTSTKEFSRLTFIDLAGSERGADTQTSSKATRMEGAEINTSLLALKEVIRALAKNNDTTHVPFRGSKLTQVLKESFVGVNSKCIMIACISPNIMNCEQTLNTLRYADRIKERNHETGYIPNSNNTCPLSPSKTNTNAITANKIAMLKKQLSMSMTSDPSVSMIGQQQEQPQSDDEKHIVTVKDIEDEDEDDELFADKEHPTPARDNRSAQQQHLYRPKEHHLHADDIEDTGYDNDGDDDDSLFAEEEDLVATAVNKKESRHRETIVSRNNDYIRQQPSTTPINRKRAALFANHNRIESNHSIDSNTSDMLDELLASPSGDDDDLLHEDDVDRSSRVAATTRAKSNPATEISEVSDLRQLLEQHQDLLRQEQQLNATELIGLHKEAMTSMLGMIKEEMILVNHAEQSNSSAGDERHECHDIFYHDYVMNVQSIHEKHLELVSILREQLSQYRKTASNQDKVVSAYKNQQQQQQQSRVVQSQTRKESLSTRHQQQQQQQSFSYRHVIDSDNNNRRRLVQDDDDSFEDLRDE